MKYLTKRNRLIHHSVAQLQKSTPWYPIGLKCGQHSAEIDSVN